MKTLIIFPMLLLSAATYAQDHQTAPNKGDQQGNSNTSQSPVKQLVVPVDTQVFVIDLGNPSAGGNKSTGQSKPLQFLSRRPVQLQLIKGNPYKYKYVVNSRFVNFFENDGQSFVEEYKKSLDTPPVPEPKAAEVQAAATDAKKTATVLHVQLTKPKTKAIEKKALSDSKNFIAGFAKSPVLSSGSFDKSDQEVISKAARSEASKKEILDAVEVVRSVYVAKAVNSQKILGDKSKIPENGADDLENFNAAVNQTKIDADKFSREVETFAKTIGKQESLADDFDKTRKSFLDRAEEFTKNYLALKYDQARLASTSTEAGGNLDSVRDTLKDTMEKIAKFFDLKMDNYTLPIDVNGKNIDALEFTVQRFENDNNPTAIDSYCYTMWIKGGLKIDFSAGLFVTSLRDHEYITKDTTVTIDGTAAARKTIREIDKGHFQFGVGTTINISHRSASWINPTLNFGGLVTTKQQFQLLAGLGAILGKQERVILSGGCAMGSVKKISDLYEADGKTTYDLGNNTEVPTKDKFEFGYYFGLTYNFSGVKKKEPNVAQ